MTPEVEQWIDGFSLEDRYRLFNITYQLSHKFSAPDLRSIHRGYKSEWTDEEFDAINKPYKDFLENLVADGYLERDKEYAWRYQIHDERESKLFFVEKCLAYLRELMMFSHEIDESISVVSSLMKHRIPFPDAAYWKRFGIEPNADGTVDTPGGIRIPTAELCEIHELEELYKL